MPSEGFCPHPDSSELFLLAGGLSDMEDQRALCR